ncbi:MAG: hypothetical protein EXQ79_05275 [Acidimicrobiia bacterium]|nr:hypothetical protein [Acidimicrobiia bacterium]
MRFLLDENLSEHLGELLLAAGHEALHVRTLGLASSDDDAILDLAEQRGAVLISPDTDFGTILAETHRTRPSIILLRRERGRRAPQQARLLLENLDQVADDLRDGAIVVLEDQRVRVRRLPIA